MAFQLLLNFTLERSFALQCMSLIGRVRDQEDWESSLTSTGEASFWSTSAFQPTDPIWEIWASGKSSGKWNDSHHLPICLFSDIFESMWSKCEHCNTEKNLRTWQVAVTEAGSDNYERRRNGQMALAAPSIVGIHSFYIWRSPQSSWSCVLLLLKRFSKKDIWTQNFCHKLQN